MRFFLTSYQKSGTHQIMPALGIRPDVVDRSGNDVRNIPFGYNVSREIMKEGVMKTCHDLASFGGAAFGHISYLPEFWNSLQKTPTKVIFNIRDPRDVVVSNYYNIRRLHFGKDPGHGHLNYFNNDTGKCLMDSDDPLSELIKIEAARWPHWLGWLDQDPELLMVVRYDELRQSGRETLERIFEWSAPHIFPDIEHSLKVMSPRTDLPSVRRCMVGEHKELFEERHMKLAEELMGDTIERLGYEI